MEELRPKVGVGVTIFKDGKVLLGKRKSSHGAGEYASPGGHLEYLESFKDCIEREVMEECGIKIKNINFQFVTNLTKYSPKHYVHIGLTADWDQGEPQVLEPEKCEGWDWYDLDKLPTPLFETSKIAFDDYKQRQYYYDSPTTK